jgi:hypothetical protein
MFLAKIAEHFFNPQFTFFARVADELLENINGRLDVATKFVTIISTGTKRRALYTDFNEDLSKFDIFTDEMTGAVYLLGVHKKGVFKGKEIVQIYLCHEVTPSKSSGLASISSMVVKGSGDDLGWLEPKHKGDTYLDVQLFSVSLEGGAKQATVGSFVGYFEKSADIRFGDTLSLDGLDYFVEERYTDAGFSVARLRNKSYSWENAVIELRKDKVYNPATGKMDSTVVTRNVTLLWIEESQVNEGFGESSLHENSTEYRIYKEHIGFTPLVGMKVALNGKTGAITGVRQEELRSQWIITVTT